MARSAAKGEAVASSKITAGRAYDICTTDIPDRDWFGFYDCVLRWVRLSFVRVRVRSR